VTIDPHILEEFVKRFDKLTCQERDELLDQLEERRVALNEHLSERSALDGFKERGLLGSLKDAPPDLSTNPTHREGFGRDAP
jgi:hypothetical protein